MTFVTFKILLLCLHCSTSRYIRDTSPRASTTTAPPPSSANNFRAPSGSQSSCYYLNPHSSDLPLTSPHMDLTSPRSFAARSKGSRIPSLYIAQEPAGSTPTAQKRNHQNFLPWPVLCICTCTAEAPPPLFPRESRPRGIYRTPGYLCCKPISNRRGRATLLRV